MISVVLPVYNGAFFLEEAIQSLFDQTFIDFEIIAIDDGSKDNSLEILEKLAQKDSRLKVYSHANRGLAATLNRGVELASYDIIARMDQDDICFPNRFKLQIAEFVNDPELALLGTWAQIVKEDGSKTSRRLNHPIDADELYYLSLFDNRFVHASVMFRKHHFNKLGGYHSDAKSQPEDFDLWSRFIHRYKCRNLPLHLLIYRESAQGMSRAGRETMELGVQTIGMRNLRQIIWWPISSHLRALTLTARGNYNHLNNSSIRWACYFLFIWISIRMSTRHSSSIKRALAFSAESRHEIIKRDFMLRKLRGAIRRLKSKVKIARA